jgi:hypothetical protein
VHAEDLLDHLLPRAVAAVRGDNRRSSMNQ